MNIKQTAFCAVAMVAGVPLVTELIRLYCIVCIAFYNFIH